MKAVIILLVLIVTSVAFTVRQSIATERGFYYCKSTAAKVLYPVKARGK